MNNNKKPSPITGSVKINLIKEFMKQKNLTEEEFAEKCHIETKQLQKVLDDFSYFEPIWLLRIARTMGKDFSDLVN